MRAVRAAWSRARADLRASRRTAIALIVVAGLAGGVVLAAAAGAHRTWAALPELLAYHQPEDAVVFLEGGLSAAEQEELFAQVADLPMVVDASRTAIVPLTELGPGGEALESELTARVVLDGPSYDRLARPLIVAGRHPRPDQAEEVAVDESLAARRGLEPGDGLEVRLEPGGPPLRLTVTGVERQPYDISAGTGAEAAPAGAHEGDDLYLTPAFWDRHRPGTVTDGVTPDSVAPDSVAMAVWLEEGAAGVDAFTEAAATVADESVLFVEPGAQDLEGVPALQRAIDVQAAALAAFAALGAVATVVILGQALSRQVVLDAADRRTLTALGMTRAQLVGAGLVRTGLIGIGAGVLAVMVAVALSPLAPIGLARRAELDPGVEVDGAVLAPGAVLLVVSLTAWGLVAAVGATRPWDPLGRSPGTTAAPSRLAERLARGNLPVPLVTGVRMALGPGQGQASVPVRTAVAGVVVGIAGVTAALVFGASLGRLLDQPELRGWNWDAAVGEYDTAEAAAEGATLLAANPDVAQFSGFVHGPMTVDGADVEVAAVTTDHGLVSSPVVTGQHPAGPGEVAFGPATLERLGKDVGDDVELALAGGPAVTARIVGTLIPPAVLVPGMTLGSGGVVTYEGALQVLSEVLGDVPPDRYLVRLRPGADEPAALARLSADFGDAVLGPTSTSDLENLRRVQDLPVALATLIGALGLATLAHALIVGVRRRRRDLAVLKAVGFRRGQVRAAVAWQATSLAGVAVLVGLPIGLLAGGWAWTLVVERLGASTATAVPLSAVVAAGAVVLVANLVAAGPGRAAARTPSAAVLQAE